MAERRIVIQYSKCGKSVGGGNQWSAGKTGKTGGGLRRLGDSWARDWAPPNMDGESTWQPSWFADSSGSWDYDDDCDPSTDESQSDVLVFVENGKAAKAKSSKSEKSVPTLRVTEDPTHKPAYIPTPKPVPTRVQVTTEDVSKMLR
jgi:hypothetical protein